MTATCAFCAAKLETPDDPLFDGDDNRAFRAVVTLTIGFAQHLQRFHPKEPQVFIDNKHFPPHKPPTVPNLIELCSALTSHLAMLSFLVSDDPAFLKRTAEMQTIVNQALKPKGDLSKRPLLVKP